MQNGLQEIDEMINTLKSLPAISEENKRKLDKKFRLEFNYNSNHIEGNTLTYGETELLLIFGKTEGVHEIREYDEMKAHDVAFKLVQEWADDKDFTLTEVHIKQLNKIILVNPFWKEAITPDGQPTKRQIEIGQYKKYTNSVRLYNGEIFEYISPTDTPIKMGELIQWYNDELKNNELHPITLAALLHYKFVYIHPFDDGNGRIARLLTNYILLKNNLPPVIIKTEEKRAYLNALNQADTGNIEAFIKYIAEQFQWSLDICIKATKGESIDETGNLQKEIVLLNKKLSSTEKHSKYPAIVYQTFLWIEKNISTPLKQSLAQFNDFFGEKKEFHFVNSRPERFETRGLLGIARAFSNEPDKVKIFGMDIYDEDITQVEWKIIMYGLKGAKAKTDMEVKIRLNYQTERYYIEVLIDYTSVSSASYPYGDIMLPSDIEKLQENFSKQILENIKTRTETNK